MPSEMDHEIQELYEEVVEDFWESLEIFFDSMYGNIYDLDIDPCDI
jgi:hypothetical protein